MSAISYRDESRYRIQADVLGITNLDKKRLSRPDLSICSRRAHFMGTNVAKFAQLRLSICDCYEEIEMLRECGAPRI